LLLGLLDQGAFNEVLLLMFHGRDYRPSIQ
jgi:hypothetical protein